ncbi:MAG: FtsQ-type POTRA domain-containing protein [Gammaproteobacteria bacterium (ex Lamellibrachia satsuma)]|nr:MAG: FtsQ-type POTRA domain-containing protein [Gammaproteobacteria bacterium (ex Lamellibrachia satsuma)]
MKRQQKKAPLSRWNNGLAFLQVWGFALLLSVLGGVGAAWGVAQLQDPKVMPLRVIGIDGEISHLDPKLLKQTVVKAIRGSFFSVDLELIRTEVEGLPWVASASVRRVWPDTLRVDVVEQVALARWGKGALVNRRGEIFRPQQRLKLPELVTLEGPESSAVAISRDFLRFEALLKTVELDLKHVLVDARQAWRLKTRRGLTLNLGRSDIASRLARFVRLYPGLGDGNEGQLEAVDLRYTNGFTARWKALPKQELSTDNPARQSGKNRIAGL